MPMIFNTQTSDFEILSDASSLDVTQECEPLSPEAVAASDARMTALVAGNDQGLATIGAARADALANGWESRQEAARLAAVGIGIEWPATFLPEGHALWESGKLALKADRAAWERKPFAADAIPVISAALEAEDRRDDTVPVRSLLLYADGTIQHGAESIGYSSHAWSQLMRQVPDCGPTEAPRGFASALLHLSGAERAQIVNARIPAASSTVTLRTRNTHNGKRVARAVLSEKYASVSDTDIATGIAYALNGDGRRARLDYKPGDARSRFEVFWPSEIAVETFRVGDVHRALVQIENSETGQGSIVIVPGLIRARCANLTLVHGAGVEVRIRHIGDAARIRGAVKAALAQAVAQLSPLVNVIQSAARKPLSEGVSVGKLFDAIAAEAQVAPERAAAWASTYQGGYAQSPTLWGVTSAMTQAAQSLGSWEEQAEEEKAASKLIAVGFAAGISAEARRSAGW